MIVVDASAWVRALVDSGPDGRAAFDVLTADPEWVAPAHAAIEALRTIRRYESAGILSSTQASAHATAVRDAEVRHIGPEPWLLDDVWAARHNISTYDAPYVAISRRFDAALVTFDERLARAAVAAGSRAIVPGRPSLEE